MKKSEEHQQIGLNHENPPHQRKINKNLQFHKEEIYK